MDTNRQINKQTDKPNLYIDEAYLFNYRQYVFSPRISDFSLEQVIAVAECKRGEHEEHVERDEHDEHNEAEVGPGLNSIQQIWISKLEKIKQ